MSSLIAIKQANGSYIITCLQYVTDLNRTIKVLYTLNNQQMRHVEKNRFRVINLERDITKHTHIYNRPDLIENYPTQVSSEAELDKFLDDNSFTYLFLHDRENWKVYDEHQQEIETH